MGTFIPAFFLCVLILSFPVYAGAAPEEPELVSLSSAGSNQITIRWKKTDNTSGYRIYRLEEGTSYVKVGETAANVFSFTDFTAKDGGVYQYTVAAFNSSGESARILYLCGTTSYQLPIANNVRFSEISKSGFRISGDIVSTDPVNTVKIPTWTEKNGQDDIVWHDAAVKGKTFSLYISSSAHNNESGAYICHIYMWTAGGKQGLYPYASSVDVPDGKTHLSGPVVTNLSPEGYDVILFFESGPGLKCAHAATKAANENDSLWENVSVSDGFIRHHINTSDHDDLKGDYSTTIYVYDKSGYSDSYTFEVNVPETECSYLNVIAVHQEHGDSTILECDGEILLLDTGRSDECFETIRVLKALGAAHFSVIITHSHSDHFGGLVEISENFTVDRIYMNDFVSTHYEDESARKIFLSFISDKKIPMESLPETGETITLSEAELKIIGPIVKHDLSISGPTNNRSAWIMITHAGHRFLFSGDAEAIVEKEMVNSGIDLQADICKVNHHGSQTSSTSEFTKAVHAKYAIIEGGEQSIVPLGENVKSNFKSAGTTVLSTETEKTISIQSLSESLTVRYYISVPKMSYLLKEDPDNPNPYLYGDINKDGKWDVRDIAFIRGHILKNNILTGEKFLIADINGDNAVDVRDIAFLRAYILKNSDSVKQR